MRKTNLALDCADGERLLPIDDAFAAIAGEARMVPDRELLPLADAARPGRSRATLPRKFPCRPSTTPQSTATA